MISNLYRNEERTVRHADLDWNMTYEDMSPLGKELFLIARDVENSDESAYSEADIQSELLQRRGGFDRNE
jgi:hypothetical protein